MLQYWARGNLPGRVVDRYFFGSTAEGVVSSQIEKKPRRETICGPTFDFLKSQNLVVFHDFLNCIFIKF